MAIEYNVPDSKRIRVIIDTDAACEADDPFAITHALLSKKLEVKAIFAEHFCVPGSTKRSFDEIQTVLRLMSMDVPVIMGAEGPLAAVDNNDVSEAASFLIKEADRADTKPLFVLCLGAITNIAQAIRKAPEITKKMTVVWIGGHGLDTGKPNHREFNAGNDVDAVNIVMSSGVEFWQIPNNVYGTMHIGIAEIQNRISVCGQIGKHLFDNLVQYNESKSAGWTQGESWALGDSPAIGVAIQPHCGKYVYRKAPMLLEDTSYEFEDNRPLIRVYESIDSRFVIEDFISKLQLEYFQNS
ncbi:MAG: nucleoside hydrolase [Spirochaetales bacterium]|nr:nucleoside hydrolase [Spirochaetales bacterium]